MRYHPPVAPILFRLLRALYDLAQWVSFRPLARRQRRQECGLCEACGYDLRHKPAHCPECGHDVSATSMAFLDERWPDPAGHPRNDPPSPLIPKTDR